ncbi:MAG: hypothetical protein JNL38_11940 [Myxococcales bacterium]|jgi:hypothetical protein|nr:hypothetical protein [Myxococcales bacterium]
MSRWNDAWQPLFDGFTRMKGKWPTRGWSWDTRLNCVTSSFTTELERAARGAVAEVFSQEFGSSSLARAPQPLRDVAERSGGVRQGQLILAAGPFAGLHAFGLWWPWGDNETISLRVGLCDVDPNREPYVRFRDVFGVSA